MNTPKTDSPSCIIDDICTILEHQENFWGDGGRAPHNASELLCNARLDRQLGLARHLKTRITSLEDEANLLLAWVTLGAITEGSLQLFLTIYFNDYIKSPLRRKGADRVPAEIMFDALITFYRDVVWIENQKNEWDAWLISVKNNRNAIHAFENRSLGTAADFHASLSKLRKLIATLESQTPQSYEHFAYPASVQNICSEVLHERSTS